MSHDAEIIAEFVIESREHLADIKNQLLAIEVAGSDVDADLVNEVFRAVHSIKGAAGFLRFTTLGELSHELETVLNLIRNRELVPNASMADVVLKAADTLSGMVEDIDRSNEVDISQHVAALEKIVGGLLAADVPAVPAAGEIETQVGVGSTVDIKLPLTLAIIPSLIVQASGRRYVRTAFNADVESGL